MTDNEVKCPYCDYENDICYFPDYFMDGEDKQIKSLLDDYNMNIVTCGMCGKAIVQEKRELKNDK
ncbi:MAG: hypothetical protein SPL73_05605 [Cyanobacteriota bacterium]|nr:hypothetical protein [Cyanobacteriota bacterium]MDY6364347.1 hypothetical protein [Cyanobacteriota bacterium]